MTAESNLGKWAPWYKGIPAGAEPRPYGTTPTYAMGAEWLKDCQLVADWGCGMGYFRKFVKPEQTYVGLDGTASPFSDVVVDLAEYRRGGMDGIFMRGVIEHDYRWRAILENAVASFTDRMCLVLFTPMLPDDFPTLLDPKQIAFVEEIGVPDLSFSMTHLDQYVGRHLVRFEDLKSDTGYGGERVIYLEKR